MTPIQRPPPPRSGGVASPCTGVCRMDPATGWCLGCRRTLDEIAAWGQMDDAGRLAVLARLRQRRLAASSLAKHPLAPVLPGQPET